VTKLIALLAVFAGLTVAQEPTFEVASIKASNLQMRVPMELKTIPGGRFYSTHVHLFGVVAKAFMVRPYNVEAPEWTKIAFYDIEATSPVDDYGTKVVPGMRDLEISMRRLQALLKERFKLQSHVEDREGVVYELTISKGGAKLQETPPVLDPDACCERVELTGHIGGSSKTTAWIANVVSIMFLHADVIDNTRLTGRYSFGIDFYNPEVPTSDDSNPSLGAALQTLGLKLEKRKGMVKYLVVDHIEKPTEN
jgi:uncharacterized protein (TIGR03435 family)